MSKVGISMSSVPAQPFLVSARENASDKTDYACTGKRPTWINNMLAKGHEMDLPTLIFQAGRHFADRVNSSVLTGSSTKREKAAALAWALISMIDPFIKNNRLWVSNPNDQDIKRLCSEILGVGAGLELLTALNVIDGRTIRKQSNRFDANTPDGKKPFISKLKGRSMEFHRQDTAILSKRSWVLQKSLRRVAPGATDEL